MVEAIFSAIAEVVMGRALDKLLTGNKPQIAKALRSLYSAMENCHLTYNRYTNNPTYQNHISWAFAIDSLIAALHQVQLDVKIFDPQIFSLIEHYVRSEARAAYMHTADPDALEMHGIRFLEEFVRSNRLLPPSAPLGTSDPHSGAAPADFDTIMGQLGEFIRTRFTLQEFFQGNR